MSTTPAGRHGSPRDGSARSATWIAGGILLALSGLPLIFQVAGVFGAPTNWALFSFAAPALLLLFPLALAVLAIGFRAEESVVDRRPVGIGALFVLALASVVLLSGLATNGVVGVVSIALQAAAAAVAVTVIARAGRVPRAVAIAGIVAAAVTALSTVASIAISSLPGGLGLVIFVVYPLTAAANLAQIVAGVALAVARMPAPGRPR